MSRSKRAVGIWLLTGVMCIYIQVVIGGITRLTGSGLSITKWEIIPGTIPPLNKAAWQKEFDLYKETSQFKKINLGMSLQSFKGIYFWEYLHRLWARLLGLIFLVPFIYFIVKRRLSGRLLKETSLLFLLGATVGLFGWVMVVSGLGDMPNVSPYKLALHLSLALITMIYAFWLALKVLAPTKQSHYKFLNRSMKWMLIIVSIQIVLGALVSGMKSALLFPTWPDMNGEILPLATEIDIGSAHIQFSHRWLGVIVFILGVLLTIFSWKKTTNQYTKVGLYVLPWLLTGQLILGIVILVQSQINIPLIPAVVHQSVAIIILLDIVFIRFFTRKPVHS